MKKYEFGEPYKEFDVREIGDLGIYSLNLGNNNAISYLVNRGITKVSQLPRVNTEDLKKSLWRYNDFRKKLLERGILFEDDKKLFAKFGLKDDAFIPLETVEGLDARAKKALLFAKKYIVFGDLVVTPYNEIAETRNIGKLGMNSIENFVNYMGYDMCNKIESKRSEYKNRGETLLEDELNLPGFRIKDLYDRQIYTMAELLTAGKDFFTSSSLSPNTKQCILEFMADNNLEFADPMIVAYDREIEALKTQCQYAENTNSAIKKRIVQKELLLKRLESLTDTTIELCAKEEELDAKIYARRINNTNK